MSEAAVTADAMTPGSVVKPKISRDDWIMRGCMGVIGIFLALFVLLPFFTLMSKSLQSEERRVGKECNSRWSR